MSVGDAMRYLFHNVTNVLPFSWIVSFIASNYIVPVAGRSGISAMGNNMDYFDRFEIEREGRRLRSEELRRLENVASTWLRAKFHGFYAKFAETLHLPHGA
jgi:hypothetical protein